MSLILRSAIRILDWTRAVVLRVIVPAEHRKKLIDAGYVVETPQGFMVTESGLRRLQRERFFCDTFHSLT